MGKWLGKSFWEDDLRVLAAPQLTVNQVLYGSVYLSLENKGESLCLKDGKDGHRAGTWTQSRKWAAQGDRKGGGLAGALSPSRRPRGTPGS